MFVFSKIEIYLREKIYNVFSPTRGFLRLNRDNLSLCAFPQKFKFCLIFARMSSETLTLAVALRREKRAWVLAILYFRVDDISTSFTIGTRESYHQRSKIKFVSHKAI